MGQQNVQAEEVTMNELMMFQTCGGILIQQIVFVVILRKYLSATGF